MNETQAEVVTRRDLQDIFKYSRNRAATVYRAIYATIPQQLRDQRPEFKRRLPKHFVDAYLGKSDNTTAPKY